MSRISLLALALATLGSPAVAQEDDAVNPATIRVGMSPCKMKRTYQSLYVRSSRHLVLEGSVDVGGETFKIYLPKDRAPYSIAPRPRRQALIPTFTSTYLAVDQNHDGKLSSWESYFAEFPLRIGDTMFEVTAIAPDGRWLTLMPHDGPLSGAVVGRQAPDLQLETVDGKAVTISGFKGKTLLIDCWSPG